MQKIIGLIGYVNKSDFAINLAKVLAIMDKKVLVIDGTVEKRLKYTLPIIEKDKKAYITNFDEVDYALGFNSLDEIKKYLCNDTIHVEDYNIILIDIDNVPYLSKFEVSNLNMTYLFFEYSNISIQKNIEIIKELLDLRPADKEFPITKVLFRDYITRVSEIYYETKLEDLNIKWSTEPYEMSYEDQDRIVDIESQQAGYTEVNKHTKYFQNIIINMVNDIIGDTSAGEIKKAIKMYVRRKS